MELQQKHKEFAIKCFASFMTRSQVTAAFMEEFAHDLPQPPIPKFNPLESNQQYISDKQEYIDKKMQLIRQEYQEMYEEDAEEMFQYDSQDLRQQLNKQYEKECKDQLENHIQEVEQHYKELKKVLSNQLRRFNITDSQFPEKYRLLFNQIREEFILKYRSENLQDADNVQSELETIYGYVKQHIFQQNNSGDGIKNANIAHNILKTIIAYNTINPKQEAIDVTQKEPKQLKDSSLSE